MFVGREDDLSRSANRTMGQARVVACHLPRPSARREVYADRGIRQAHGGRRYRAGSSGLHRWSSSKDGSLSSDTNSRI